MLSTSVADISVCTGCKCCWPNLRFISIETYMYLCLVSDLNRIFLGILFSEILTNSPEKYPHLHFSNI